MRFSDFSCALFGLFFVVSCTPEPPRETDEGKAGTPPIEFSVMAYNVENLFDVDGVALFDDYKPEVYGARQLLTKARNAARIIAQSDRGNAPDILIIQECEGDQTPGDWSGDISKALASFEGKSLEEILADHVASPYEGLPSYIWLLLALKDVGVEYPHVAVAEYAPPATVDDGPVHVNTTFSRFPISEVRTHHTVGARSILETAVDVHDHPLIIFNNHWKSGASNPDTEPIRVGNAQVLRHRLNVIFNNDPRADVIVAGDLNSHYNQAALFPDLEVTAVYHVLGSRGDELGIRGSNGKFLYNLWFDLPFEGRGSELYRGKWGTLMQMVVSEGLYNYDGIQILDNSFVVIRLPGVNEHPVTGAPLDWVGAGDGSGFSDHYPVLARFRAVSDDDPHRYMDLSNPSRLDMGPISLPEFDYGSINIEALPAWTGDTVPSAEKVGNFFRVQSIVAQNRPFEIEIGNRRFGIWSPLPELRERIYGAYSKGDEFSFTGEFGRHRGRWQFVIEDASWMP